MKDFYTGTPCPICGGREYSWGQLQALGIAYVDDNASFVSRNYRRGGFPKARHCDVCGNMQIFTRDEIENNR